MTATEDSKSIARLIRSKHTPALVIDTSVRPQAKLKELAAELEASYLPLPRADAHKVSHAIGAMLE